MDKLEAAAPSGPAHSESKRIQEMMEDLYSRVGDLEGGRRKRHGRSRSERRPEALAQLKPQDGRWFWGKGQVSLSLSQRP